MTSNTAPPTVSNPTESPALNLSEEQIIGFATQFDPQPYHLDRAAGDASIFGGLCASGWQVAALGTRLIGDALKQQDMDFVSLISVDSMRWRQPTFVDEELRALTRVERVEPTCSVPGCQTAVISAEIINQAGDVVAVLSGRAAIDAGGHPA